MSHVRMDGGFWHLRNHHARPCRCLVGMGQQPAEAGFRPVCPFGAPFTPQNYLLVWP